MKNKFGFILVKPQLGENIGACARSMKNFGFSKLYIVDPKINFPNNKAKATSVGAYDIINKAKVFKKVEKYYNYFSDLKLLDYKVRILNTGTEATTRVLIESTDKTGVSWFTVGVSPNIIEASFKALIDSLDYKLYKEKAPANLNEK